MTTSFGGLNDATFRDNRWGNAMEHIRSQGLCEDMASAQTLLRKGAWAFGLWCVSEDTLAALARHLIDEEPKVSPALKAWLDDHDKYADLGEEGMTRCKRFSGKRTTRKLHTARTTASVALAGRTKSCASITDSDVQHFVRNRRPWRRWGRSPGPRVVSFAIVSAASFLFAFPRSEEDRLKVQVFGAALVFSRTTGVGSLIWTALLFLSMARSMLKILNRWLPSMSSILHENAKFHVFCGQMVLLNGLAHTLAHLASTYTALTRRTPGELNSALNCAADLPTSAHLRLPFLRWMPCPLDRTYSYTSALFAAEGLTGFLLLAVILLLGLTGSRKRRAQNYELFWYVHNAGVVLWLALLFVHGTQGWFGTAVPLVVPFCALPVAIYSVDRVMRLLRYYFGRDVGILSVVIRPGKDGGKRGALTALKVSKPSRFWRFQEEGMYAYICMPEYSPWQWHPFTICSSRHDETVDFIISGVGDWTQELAQQCLDFKTGQRADLPVIAIDGPYDAPATKAIRCEILIAVGAGVGITPFLALMAHIVAVLGEDDTSKDPPLQEAHFFWMARSADEFLFGRSHFTKILTCPRLRDKVFVHLHLTAQEPARNAPAYVFREAIRRQSDLDRRAFLAASRRLSTEELISGAQLPWCWVNGAERSDVLWVSSLVEPDCEQEEDLLAQAYRDHGWAHGVGVAASAAGRQRRGMGLLGKHASMSSMGSRLSSTSLAATSSVTRLSGLNAMLPVTFGRPDFATEIQAIGKARPEHDVNVHVCGSQMLVEALENICDLCTERAALGAEETGCHRRPQHYGLHKETFAAGPAIRGAPPKGPPRTP